MELIHMTAVYSNAVLVAILPHVSDFAKKLDLPIPQPVTVEQVVHSGITPYKGEIGGGVWLSNGFWFTYTDGRVDSFRSPDNFFSREDILESWHKFVGKENMTTNEAIAFAQQTLRKLGYRVEDVHADVPPATVQFPFDFQGQHIPQFQIVWDTGETNSGLSDMSTYVKVGINLDKKIITELTIMGRKLRQPPPKVDVEPELESHFRERTKAKLFVRTNAPPVLK